MFNEVKYILNKDISQKNERKESQTSVVGCAALLYKAKMQ